MSSPPATGRGRGIAPAVFAAALVASVAAWAVGESPLVRVAPEEAPLSVMGIRTQTTAPTAESILEAERQSALRSLAAFGAFLGLSLGLAAGLARRDARAAAVAGGVGLVLGGLLGAVAPLGAMPLYEAMRTPGKQDLLPPMVMHLALWAPAGAAAGLAFGLGSRARPAALAGTALAGAVGAAIGAVAFQVIGTLAFPMAGVDKVLATTPVSRLVGRLIVAASIGLVVGSAGKPPAR